MVSMQQRLLSKKTNSSSELAVSLWRCTGRRHPFFVFREDGIRDAHPEEE